MIIGDFVHAILSVNYFAGAITFLVGTIIIKVAGAVIRAALKASRFNQSLVEVISSFSNFVMYLVLVAIVLAALGFTKAAEIVGLLGGAFAVAFGFGAQYFISNVIAGLNLATDEDFQVGYRVKIGDVEGTVKRMDHRKVRVLDQNKKSHVFPNKFVEDNPWIIINKGSK